jgi:diketogulonate reductase-like aldo/keto reductase
MRAFEDTMEVWFTFEQLHHEGKARNLGISNIYDITLLQEIFQKANVKPTFIQNRFYKQTGYDVDIRNFCKSNGMFYESFWTLSANPHILSNPVVQKLAKKYDKTAEQIFFYFIRSQDIIFLTGKASNTATVTFFKGFVLFEYQINIKNLVCTIIYYFYCDFFILSVS